MKLKLQDRPTVMQRRLLITHMKETRYIEGKGKERKYQWAKITTELNAVGPPKTLAQWKKQWQNLRLATRKKLQEISRRHPGSPIPELTEEDNEIMFIESTQPESSNKDTTNTSNDADMITQFKMETSGMYTSYPNDLTGPSTSRGSDEKQRKKYTRKIKPPPVDEIIDEDGNMNYVQPRTKASMEIKARAFRGLCDQAKQGRRKKKHMNSDELFMLSFVEDLKKIPEYKRLDVKTDIIAVFKKWSCKTQETQCDSVIERQQDDSRFENQQEETFDSEKQFIRSVSQLSHHSNNLGVTNLPLNLHHHQQSHSSPLNPSVQHQHHLSSPSLLQTQHQQHPHQPQQQQKHSQLQQHLPHQLSIPILPNQHFPIYHRYGL